MIMSWENLKWCLALFGGLAMIALALYLGVSIIHKRWWTEPVEKYEDDDEE